MLRNAIRRVVQYLPVTGRTVSAAAARQRELAQRQHREVTASLEALDSQIARLQSALLPYGDGERVGPGHEHSGMSDALAELTAAVEDVRRGSRAGRRAAREAVWSAIYHDTIAESEWFTEKAVSPGRWAVGYPFLYVLYRVLDEMRPTTILELGLGQSTKVAAQYAQGTDGIAHTVVEHDPEWITNFAANFALPSTTRVRRLDLTTVEQDEGEPVLRYDEFADAVGDARYDLIVVDGPFGGGAERARIDVLDLIPHSLAERFVIMLDDYNRPGERRTAESILESLEAAGIAYETTTYEGEKSLWVVTSPDLKFFTSL